MIFGGARRDGKPRWRTLSHEGVGFPELPIGNKTIAIGYKRSRVQLAPGLAQTMLVDYVQRGGTRTEFMGREQYAHNFWCDWSKLLPAQAKATLLDFKDCDISQASKIVLSKPPAAAARPLVAVVDGTKTVAISPWMVDRPGVFVGRTKYAHLTGRIRLPIGPGDVTLNIGAGQRAPRPPRAARGSWKAVMHDPTVDWVASWRDPVTMVVKYARFSSSSDIEQEAARKRFDVARTFHNTVLTPLKRSIVSDLQHDAPGSLQQQRHLCLWLILELGLRIGSGGHNGRSAKSGSFGAATLLRKHVDLLGKGGLRLDFPGKDGVRYLRTMRGVPAAVRKAFGELVRSRDPDAPVFPDVTRTSDINDTLVDRHPDITAKVIRTALASALFEETLLRLQRSAESEAKSIDKARASRMIRVANARVAAFCNHRKAAKRSRAGAGREAEAEAEADAYTDIADLEAWFRRDRDALESGLAETIRDARLILSTSRKSYIDPRIEHAFLKRLEARGVAVPASTASVQRAAWATDVAGSYRFAIKNRRSE